MKKLMLALTVVLVLFMACPAATTANATPAPKSKEDVSYAFGYLIGTDIAATKVPIDYNVFLNAIKDAIEKKPSKFTEQQSQEIIQGAIQEIQAQIGKENSEKEKAFFETNGKKAGVITTASGLQYEVITEGKGPKPQATDMVTVDYIGTLLDGKEFDSSIKRGEPATFQLNGVIPGWTEAIQLMAVGSKYKLYIPSALAYGPQAASELIGPNSTLIFEVSLLKFEKAPEAPVSPN